MPELSMKEMPEKSKMSARLQHRRVDLLAQTAGSVMIDLATQQRGEGVARTLQFYLYHLKHPF